VSTPAPTRIREAAFLAGAARADQLPADDAPELAFAGRSNVGKSSLLQSLVGRRGLVRISSTPGRTRQINLFSVDVVDTGRLVLADLPGYGFARVSKAERRSWGPLVEQYLESRGTLRAVVVIVDARRGPEPDDEQLVEYLRSIERRALVVATKIDKLPKNRVKPAVQAIAAGLGVRAYGFTAVTGAGRDDLWTALLRSCARSANDRGPPPSA